MIKDYLSDPNYNYETVNRASKACGPLVKWAIAQVSYAMFYMHVLYTWKFHWTKKVQHPYCWSIKFGGINFHQCGKSCHIHYAIINSSSETFTCMIVPTSLVHYTFLSLSPSLPLSLPLSHSMHIHSSTMLTCWTGLILSVVSYRLWRSRQKPLESSLKGDEINKIINELEASINKNKEEYAFLISEANAIKSDLETVEAKVGTNR